MKRHALTLIAISCDALGQIVCGTLLVLMIAACASPSPTLSPRTAALAEMAHAPVSSCSAAPPAAGEIPSGCTVFTVVKGDRVFFGGNDDYINPDSYYWVDPGGVKGYGAIWIGMPDNVQQGVNEKGLAYDANGLPRVDVNPHRERAPVAGDYSSYPIHILRACATVEEVIAWVNTHQWHSYMHDQMQFADATGDAVIISAGADGEVVFTRKPRGDGYLVSTNFNIANPANGYGYPCPRYQTAQKRLGRLVNRAGELTAQDAASVLDAVHVAGASWTIESLVADLPNGIVYLYYFHQFDKPVVLNVAEEIAKGRAGRPLSTLFPEDVRQEAARRYQRIQSGRSGWQTFGKAWAGLVVVSLVLLLVGSVKQRSSHAGCGAPAQAASFDCAARTNALLRSGCSESIFRTRCLIFWLPVVAILGPLGLLIWLIAGRGRRIGHWRTALVEAAGDVAPTVVAFIVAAVGLVLVPAALASQTLQLLLFFGLPPLIGLFVFQGPLLACATRKGYFRTLLQRLPHAWVVANLGMAGIFAPAILLANMSAQLPLPPWIVVAWWGCTVVSSLAALLLLLVYEGWCVRRAYRAWSVLAWGEGELVTPSWRKLWWWILLSYAALFGGVVLNGVIQQMLQG